MSTVQFFCLCAVILASSASGKMFNVVGGWACVGVAILFWMAGA